MQQVMLGDFLPFIPNCSRTNGVASCDFLITLSCMLPSSICITLVGVHFCETILKPWSSWDVLRKKGGGVIYEIYGVLC